MIRAIGFLLPSLALASSSVVTSWTGRAQRADRVVLVQVLDQRTEIPDGDVRRMRTVTRLQVGENLKGEGPSQIEVLQLGGRQGLWEAHVPGDATFVTGETAVLLLRCRRGVVDGWAQCTLAGLQAAKLPMREGAAWVPGPHGGSEKKTLAELRRTLASGAKR